MKLLRQSLLVSLLLTSVSATAAGSQCRCFPGDACWPSDAEWHHLNSTLSGRLIKTVPLGSPCHDPTYDKTQCAYLRAQWQRVPIHLNSPSSVAPIFANASCDVFTPRTSPCLMGNYVAYSVNATVAADIAAAIKFADRRNIRLVIRNTGHDYMGRSTGAGGLAIWTHHLKSMELKDWKTREHRGKVLRVGAGVEGHDVLTAAAAAGLVMVTGECPSVGVAGGYSQSGGHSPLSTAFGLGADQLLEMEVVTADGRLVAASPCKNADLFWALSGSGSGAFGVVVSATLKAHPDAVTAGASFTVQEKGRNHIDFLNAWHEVLPGIIDSGTQATYLAQAGIISAPAITAFNQTKAQLAAALDPFITKMAALGVALQPNYTEFRSYHEHYKQYFGMTAEDGHLESVGTSLIGGRFIPRDKVTAIIPAVNETFELGAGFIGQSINVTRFRSNSRAVMPQWRDALIMSAPYLPYRSDVPFSQMEAQQAIITQQIMPKMEALTPGSGAYINEADFQQPNWQETFYGDNYERLSRVKKRYDPKGLFYAPISVGAEKWKVQPDGRLCAVKQ